jgi:DNA-binding response OmpR family regulator
MSSSDETVNRRQAQRPDRRRFARGGRREGDLPGHHPTVAIIDRYEGVRRPCARYLQHFNFEVVESTDVDSGLTLLESARPAVILIEDAASKGFARLQEAARALSIPFVAMAATFTDAPASGAEPTPGDGVLVKPFTLGTMLDEIRRVLRARMIGSAVNSA